MHTRWGIKATIPETETVEVGRAYLMFDADRILKYTYVEIKAWPHDANRVMYTINNRWFDYTEAKKSGVRFFGPIELQGIEGL